MFRIVLPLAMLGALVQPSQAAFYWEGLAPFMDKQYCLQHYPAERCAAMVRAQVQVQVRTETRKEVVTARPNRPVAQK
jgi:hypothetical protein